MCVQSDGRDWPEVDEGGNKTAQQEWRGASISKQETTDLEMDSNERKEAELCKNRLGDRSCLQTAGHIQAIPPPEGTNNALLHCAIWSQHQPLLPHSFPLSSPLYLIPAPAREAGQLAPGQEKW